MRRALINLVRNAIQATPPGGRVTVTIREADRVRWRSGSPTKVRDSIQALAGQVFDPFVTGRESGTGLGLALVRRVVEEHEGSVSLESLPTVGAEASCGSTPQGNPAMTTLTGRILVVEDDPSQREMLADFLRDQGAEVFEADSGSQGPRATRRPLAGCRRHRSAHAWNRRSRPAASNPADQSRDSSRHRHGLRHGGRSCRAASRMALRTISSSPWTSVLWSTSSLEPSRSAT